MNKLLFPVVAWRGCWFCYLVATSKSMSRIHANYLKGIENIKKKRFMLQVLRMQEQTNKHFFVDNFLLIEFCILWKNHLSSNLSGLTESLVKVKSIIYSRFFFFFFSIVIGRSILTYTKEMFIFSRRYSLKLSNRFLK